jgi:periplasmic divalent cation tolerance protein
MVLTTVDSRAAARSLARSALAARLAACAQIAGPVESVYWWEGALDSAEEWQVWFKTSAERYDALADHIGAEHSYEVPEIIRIPVDDGSAAYLSWIREETALDLRSP